VVPEVRELLGAHFAGAYRPDATNDGWSLDFMIGAGTTATTHIAAFRAVVLQLRAERGRVAQRPRSPACFDSFRIDSNA
jgi:hypothetical protein